MNNSEEAIFCQAIEMPIDQRAEFVRNACSGDHELAASVQKLLQIHDTEDEFLATPAIDIAVDTIDEQPGEMVGNYRLEKQIGEGGFGVVWQAEQLKPVRRPVALKIVKLGMDSKNIVGRFDKERQILALMNHPNIATVLDAGMTDGGRPFFVMELVDGQSIAEFCNENNLAVFRRLKIFVTVCRAVQHAHQKGIVHRDLKPTNILISRNGSEFIPKIIDFGIAKAIQNNRGRNLERVDGQLIGTPQYMSPEQLRDDIDVDARSDIYSLGIVLRRLVASSVTNNKQVDSTSSPKTNQKHSPPINPELDWICSKATSAERDNRYQSASELAMDVERFLDCQPVLASPASRSYLVKKFVQRNKLLVGSAVAVAAAVVVACFALAFGLVYANQQKLVAEQEREKADQQKTIALDEADEARKVAGILKQMVVGASPKSSNPIGYTLREHLDVISESLDQLADHPEVEAELCQTIAIAYHNLSQIDKAYVHYKRALDLRVVNLGESDPLTLSSRSFYARCLISMSRLEEAEIQLDMILKLYDDIEPDKNYLRALDNLAAIRSMQRRFDEAYELASQCLVISSARYGDDHPNTLESMERYASAAQRLDRHEEAEEIMRKVLDKQMQADSLSTFEISNTKFRLAGILKDLKQYEEAKELVASALEQQTLNLGETDVHVIRCLTRLAEIHLLQDDLKSAEKYARDAVARAEQRPESQLSIRATAYRRLAVVLQTIDPHESEKFWEKAVDFRHRAIGDHLQIGSWLLKRAEVLTELEELKEALQCLERAIAILKRLPNGEGMLKHSYERCSDLLIRLEQPELAEEYKAAARAIEGH